MIPDNSIFSFVINCINIQISTQINIQRSVFLIPQQYIVFTCKVFQILEMKANQLYANCYYYLQRE